jgi:hypothetical protein
MKRSNKQTRQNIDQPSLLQTAADTDISPMVESIRNTGKKQFKDGNFQVWNYRSMVVPF